MNGKKHNGFIKKINIDGLDLDSDFTGDNYYEFVLPNEILFIDAIKRLQGNFKQEKTLIESTNQG